MLTQPCDGPARLVDINSLLRLCLRAPQYSRVTGSCATPPTASTGRQRGSWCNMVFRTTATVTPSVIYLQYAAWRCVSWLRDSRSWFHATIFASFDLTMRLDVSCCPADILHDIQALLQSQHLKHMICVVALPGNANA